MAGFSPHPAQNVDEALAILENEHVDAVSLDMCMPDSKGLKRTGLSFLTILRAMPDRASLPAMIRTGMPLSIEDEDTARRLNAQVFYKPQSYSRTRRAFESRAQRSPVPERV